MAQTSTHKTPQASVKEIFGEKKKLVEAVEKFTTDDLWVSRTNKDKGLAHVSNAKLLHLHTVFTAVKEKFGTRAKLIDAILELEKHTKDEGYKAALGKHPVPRLYDLYRSAHKRSTRASEKPVAAKAEAKPAKAEAKPAAKPAAPKKAAAAAEKKKPAAKK